MHVFVIAFIVSLMDFVCCYTLKLIEISIPIGVIL